MARIRSIKPEIRTSEKVNAWPIELRYFWILLWGYCDDYGRGKDNARLIVADAFPLDDSISPETVAAWLDILERDDVITRYEVAGAKYFCVTNWTEHQKVQHPGKQVIPPPSGNTHETVTSLPETLTPEGEQGAEEQGGGGEPPRGCPKHPDNTDEPCTPCGRAREQHKAWLTQKANRPTPQAELPPEYCRTHFLHNPCPACDGTIAPAPERTAS